MTNAASMPLKIGRIFAMMLLFSNHAFAFSCLKTLENGDSKGYPSTEELFKSYSGVLGDENARVYTPAEIDVIRKQFHFKRDIPAERIGTQFRKKIRFVKIGIAKHLMSHYEEMMAPGLSVEKAIEGAQLQAKLLFGDSLFSNQILNLKTLSAFFSDEQVHVNYTEEGSITQAVASDVFLMQMLQLRLKNHFTQMNNIQRQGLENYRLQAENLKKRSNSMILNRLKN
jgi:hypothetical protein